jgi:G:T-mismatch repair DNA endonuclease (very short patch repair protein)
MRNTKTKTVGKGLPEFVKKNQYSKPSFALKKKIIQLVVNGQISKHHASVKYNLSRGSIDYWLKKFTTLDEAERYMETDKELKRLQKRIQELEWIKEFQQDLIVEFEKTTGKELSKKFLPEYLAKEIAKKKHSQKK